MQLSVENGAFLLLVAAGVAMLTKRIRLPYSVGLVVAGIVLAFLPFAPGVSLTKELLFQTLLPPLIFEAAFYIPWKELRHNLAVVLLLATAGLALSAGITTLGMHYFDSWPWSTALVFGVLIAATDPVSVIATFKEAGVTGRLRLLVESESLFNDGTAAVGFAVVSTIAAGHSLSPMDMTSMFLTTAGGGLLCGLLVGGLILLFAWRTEDHLVELTFTTIAAYGSFLLAEHFHCSGVLATLTTGLMLGNLGSLGSLTAKGGDSLHVFWEYAAFVANSFVFLLIGMRGAQQHFKDFWFSAFIAIAMVTIGRAAAVYPACFVFVKSPLRVKTSHQHVLFWGGLRGALALALALGLPDDVPQRDDILAMSFAVVAFSVFVQGLTMKPLLRRMGEIS